MTVTIYGELADELGHHHDRDNRSPASNYRRRQPHDIGVDLEHRGEVLGQVVHLERRHDRLNAVAVLELEASDLDAFGDCWWSASTRATPHHGLDRDIELVGLAITKTPASVGLRPLRWLAGDVREHRGRWGRVPELIERSVRPALEHRWRCTAPLTIHEPDTAPYISAQIRLDEMFEQDIRPLAPIEHVGGGRIISVR